VADDSCKRTLEMTIPVAEVAAETERVVAEIQKKVKLPGFRPGKTPASIIRTRFQSDIRQQVVEGIVPRAFRAQAEKEHFKVVGTPNIAEIKFEPGEPIWFKADFEVAPEFELGEYRGLTVPYADPQVSDEDIEERLTGLRDRKAEYVNIDPRPLADGDYAVVSLLSTAGVEGEPVQSDEMILHIGDSQTMPEFSEALRGLEPGAVKSVTIDYPENYAAERLAGKKVTFEVTVKGLRRKELPEANDEFAADMGDFKSIGELREEIRRDILRERESAAKSEAQSKLVDALVDGHVFQVPDAYVDRQIEMNLESRLRELASQGVDPRKLKIDWEELKKAGADRARRDVKASLLLDKVADREAIETLNDEVDREIHRASKQMREPAAAVRMKFEKDGTLRNIVARIRTEKTLNFLFENARKVAPETVPQD
jgi:trigger factor